MATQHAALKRLASPLDKFIVDGFNFCEPSIRHYFLTHAHSDHTTGLHASFDLGTIYCSSITARVLRATLGLKQKLLCTVDAGEAIEVEGITVVGIDAGHCPGALMFLFFDPATGHRALHTGDCRASERVRHATLDALAHRPAATGPTSAVPAASSRTAALPGEAAAEGATFDVAAAGSSSGTPTAAAALDVLYLDTTYAQPRWTFPPVEAALEAISRLVTTELERGTASRFSNRAAPHVAPLCGLCARTFPPAQHVSPDATELTDSRATRRWQSPTRCL